jgi:hypothetical protein
MLDIDLDDGEEGPFRLQYDPKQFDLDSED